jgi:hypothetical protein
VGFFIVHREEKAVSMLLFWGREKCKMEVEYRNVLVAPNTGKKILFVCGLSAKDAKEDLWRISGMRISWRLRLLQNFFEKVRFPILGPLHLFYLTPTKTMLSLLTKSDHEAIQEICSRNYRLKSTKNSIVMTLDGWNQSEKKFCRLRSEKIVWLWLGLAMKKISENKQNFRYFPSRFSAFHTLEASNSTTFRTHDNWSPFGAAFPTFYNKNLDERHKKNLHYLVFNAALNRETVKDALCTAPEARKEFFLLHFYFEPQRRCIRRLCALKLINPGDFREEMKVCTGNFTRKSTLPATFTERSESFFFLLFPTRLSLSPSRLSLA